MQPNSLTKFPDTSQNPLKTCIVIVFLGTWPVWVRYFLQSCSENRKFHWLIFGNAPSITPLPDNVRHISIDQHWLEQRVSEKLGVPWQMVRGYKLVDLKPAYGHIFSEWLQEYDFWGYTDMDVIYGRLDDFITPAILRTQDIITAHDKVLVGHFSLLRNTQHFCYLYQQADDWLEVLANEHPAGFDEKGFQILVKSLAATGKLALYAKTISTEDIRLRLTRRPQFLMLWYSGRLYDIFGFRATAYFHFMESKWSSNFHTEQPADFAGPFFLHNRGIQSLSRLSNYPLFIYLLLRTLACTIPFYGIAIIKALTPERLRKILRRESPKR